jgi:hypothetical protein
MVSLPAAVDGARLVAALALVLFLPGELVLTAAGHRSHGYTRLALALGTSIALWPLALLWSTRAGAQWTQDGLRIAACAAVALGGAYWLVRRLRRTRPRISALAVALTVVVAVGAILRILQVHGVAVPLWVDGYHHTLVTEIIRTRGVVPADLRPYLPIDRFYYHFGFHTLAAAVAWLSGVRSPAAVLWTGQALNALSALSAFLLARRLTRHGPSAIVAAAIPAAICWFPSYYLTWGRYTQLAGLVALPAAWILLAEATVVGTDRRRRRVVLAALVAGGLALVHYRVFVFFVIGALVIAAALRPWRRAGAGRMARWVAVGAVGAAATGPWLLGDLLGGARALAAAGATWFGGPTGVADVPSWLFTTGLNAPVLVLAVQGVFVGLVRRRGAALLVLAWLAGALVVVFPDRLGVAASWTLPPFALAISLWLPAAMGIAFLTDAALDLAGSGDAARRARRALALVAVTVAVLGARQLGSVVNPETVIATPADVAAAAWVRTHTPPEARFLVSTAHWHLGTYRGLDGGYWLPLLAERDVSIPASFYTFADPAYAAEVTAVAEEAARGDDLSDGEIVGLMARVGAEYVYLGPAASGVAGKLSADRLRRIRRLEEVYDADGVHVWRLRRRLE